MRQVYEKEVEKDRNTCDVEREAGIRIDSRGGRELSADANIRIYQVGGVAPIAVCMFDITVGR